MAERKYHDVKSLYNIIPAGPDNLLWSLTEVPLGSNDTSRVGDQIMLNSIEVTMKLTYGLQFLEPFSSVTATNQCKTEVRVIIFQWKDDALPVKANIVQQTTSTMDSIMGPLDHDLKVKRKLLFDKVYSLDRDVIPISTTNVVSQPHSNSMKIIKIFMDFKKKSMSRRRVYYQGGSLEGVNKVYALVIGNILSNAITNSNLYVESWSRINYTDM